MRALTAARSLHPPPPGSGKRGRGNSIGCANPRGGRTDNAIGTHLPTSARRKSDSIDQAVAARGQEATVENIGRGRPPGEFDILPDLIDRTLQALRIDGAD